MHIPSSLPLTKGVGHILQLLIIVCNLPSASECGNWNATGFLAFQHSAASELNLCTSVRFETNLHINQENSGQLIIIY